MRNNPRLINYSCTRVRDKDKVLSKRNSIRPRITTERFYLIEVLRSRPRNISPFDNYTLCRISKRQVASVHRNEIEFRKRASRPFGNVARSQARSRFRIACRVFVRGDRMLRARAELVRLCRRRAAVR